MVEKARDYNETHSNWKKSFIISKENPMKPEPEPVVRATRSLATIAKASEPVMNGHSR